MKSIIIIFFSIVFIACSNKWSEDDKHRLDIIALSMVVSQNVKQNNQEKYVGCYKKSIMNKYSGLEFTSQDKRPEIIIYAIKICANYK